MNKYLEELKEVINEGKGYIDSYVSKYVQSEVINHYGELLFLTKSGSYLYGTNSEKSDRDYVGVYMMPLDKRLGLYTKHDTINLSIENKDNKNKNTKYAVDIKIYEIEKFVKLLVENNPNMLEILFAETNSDAVLYNNFKFKAIQANYLLFLSSKARNKFYGFANNVYNKALNVIKNTDRLFEFTKLLTNFIEKYPEFKDKPLFYALHYPEFKHYTANNGVLFISWYKFNTKTPINTILKENKSIINDEINSKYIKNLYHALRITDEGIQLLKYHHIKFPLKDRKLYANIKNGKVNNVDLYMYIGERLNILKSVKTTLPNKPYIEEINSLYKKIITYKEDD
jgi:predicted nucleotidyltransferase